MDVARHEILPHVSRAVEHGGIVYVSGADATDHSGGEAYPVAPGVINIL